MGGNNFYTHAQPTKARCRVRGCSEAGALQRAAGYCRGHWQALPEDLKVRWTEGRTSDDPYERESARRAIDDFFDAETGDPA